MALLGIGPKFKAYFPDYDLLILEYVPGITCSPEIARDTRTIKLIVKTLRQLHQSKPFQGLNNPFDFIRNSVELAKQKKSWLPPDIEVLMSNLKSLEDKLKFNPKVPCHMDLMIENLFLNKSNIKIIDWEYSANSDPRFDLAMISFKGRFEKEHDIILLKEYGEPELFNDIQLMKAVVALREVAWGITQIAVSTISRDYKTYAEIDLEKFRKQMSALKIQ